jgi:hypothetical protein
MTYECIIILVLLTVSVIIVAGCTSTGSTSVTEQIRTTPTPQIIYVTVTATSTPTPIIQGTPVTVDTLTVLCTVNYETGTCPDGKCWVRDYCRKDGTHVDGYCRKCE